MSALAADSDPPDDLSRGDYRWLKVGAYRMMYVVEVDVITIERVDCVGSRRKYGRPWSS